MCGWSLILQKLDLRQQLGLANLALHCPWLQVVDLSECESLTDAVCNVFSDGGGCPRLNSLTLDNCDVKFLHPSKSKGRLLTLLTTFFLQT